MCPYLACRALPSRVVKFGKYFRADDRKVVQRYRCTTCKRTFSAGTGKDTWWQKKRTLNGEIRGLLSIKVSLNAISRHLGVSRELVSHRLVFWGNRARRYFHDLRPTNLLHVQFDEMQSSIHTKCKPVSIPMAVDHSRRILALCVVSMPAQHPLIETAMKKYGPRADDRRAGIAYVLTQIRPMLSPCAQVTTDKCERYPGPIRRLLPGTAHVTTKGKRGCSWAQGELKKTGFDPIFSFNHTAATMRDTVSRLVRKTWGNSKRMDRLEDHMFLYAHFHNAFRIPKAA